MARTWLYYLPRMVPVEQLDLRMACIHVTLWGRRASVIYQYRQPEERKWDEFIFFLSLSYYQTQTVQLALSEDFVAGND
jgi:hypothetical protein